MYKRQNPDTVITRAHVARAMVEAGYAPSLDQAYKRYLRYGGKYCPRKASPAPEEVVSALLSGGAFVSLAHPYQYNLGDGGIRTLVTQMKEMGMQGLEVYHSSHNQHCLLYTSFLTCPGKCFSSPSASHGQLSRNVPPSTSS